MSETLIENNPEALLALADNLKKRIEEDLSEGQPMYSRSAYTHRRTVHRAFLNGVQREDSVDFRPPLDPGVFPPDELIDRTWTAVKAYRQEIVGNAVLVWRCEPKFEHTDDGKLNLYVRLCFEPQLIALEHGVWIEEPRTR